MATFVLVHGAWHGGWCWRKVTHILQENGHIVYTPTLTGLGERVHLLNKEVDLETHIYDVLNVIKYEHLHKVILVGHSYAGMVITGVADLIPSNIAHLVFVDAVVPHSGESFLDCVPSWTGFKQQVETINGLILPPPNVALPFGITSEDDARWVNSNLAPHPIKSLKDKLNINNYEVCQNMRTYILCHSNDKPVSASLATERATSELGWDFVELDTGHDAMVTAPEDLYHILINISKPSSST